MASRSRELHGFVDDEEDPPQKEQDWMPDLDTLFAYRTMRMVRIQDRKLGILYAVVVLFVMFYVVMFALYYNGKHQLEAAGVGSVVTKFTGKAFHDGMAYDWVDLRYPETEPAGTFIATRTVTQKGQKVGKCVDFDQPCPCRDDAECVETPEGSFCKDDAWCPSIGEGNVDTVAESSNVERMEGLEHTTVEIQAGIAFTRLTDHFFVCGKSNKKATNPLRYISLGELLAKGDIKVNDMVDTGGVVSVVFQWGTSIAPCDVMLPETCEPVIRVKRIDCQTEGQCRGFVTKRSSKRREGDEWVRDAQMMYGIRLLVDSAGIGRRFDFVLAMIQLGSLLALMRTAAMIADFMMLNCYPAAMCDLYYKCKVKETKDFSDLKDRLNIIEENREEVSALLHRAGASRTLGLGPGGRGGMASQILKRP